MHFMGELVVHRTRSRRSPPRPTSPASPQAMQDLTRTSQALQAMVMQVRMIPVEAVFLRFPRLVRDLSTKLGKQVELELVGKETELDRTVVDALGDPIVHLVRNSLDHGLEPPEERIADGKAPTGTLEISARHAGGNVVISVRDDGRGIDPARVARKAAERGLIPAEAIDSIDSAAGRELLFAPGFSTAETTSDISGRGVGMDAVRTTIRELGGDVTLDVRARRRHDRADPPAAHAGDHERAARRDRAARRSRCRSTASSARSSSPTTRSARSPAPQMLVLDDGVLPIVDAGAFLGASSGEERGHGVIVARRRPPLRARHRPPDRPARARHPPASVRSLRGRAAHRRRRARQTARSP